MQKTPSLLASRIFPALAAALMLFLVAGCNLTITNLTPDTVPQNPSQIYTITASFRASSQVETATIRPRIIIDGSAYAMNRSPAGIDIWEFDYQLPAGRTTASYYFICDYQTKGSAETMDLYSELQHLKIAGRYVIRPEATRAPVGSRVSILGAGFTTADLVYFDNNPTRTVFESPSSLSFFVPAVVPGRSYKLTIRGAGVGLDVGSFRVDAISFQVSPSAVVLRPGEQQAVTFTIPQPAPAGGLLIDVTTDVPESVVMPVVMVEAGRTDVTVPIQGGKPGTGSLFFRSSVGESSIAVTVTAN
ncbi:hypothetical protein Verru16b_02291 [Lacunisphaera limnophila]|uniref:IPT/TIG domain-containing protein n=1 Tax=Lacunisphaera limnophila TaxID=1838286 RepID=A0A1D8AWF6_9BACT|nr:IPT/TIG domain-containing protein [Lacunisphaera limnophila]AOS45213.1 hypothetical protein Verru16b_02291 [Lacunisphaera limnophila]